MIRCSWLWLMHGLRVRCCNEWNQGQSESANWGAMHSICGERELSRPAHNPRRRSISEYYPPPLCFPMLHLRLSVLRLSIAKSADIASQSDLIIRFFDEGATTTTAIAGGEPAARDASGRRAFYATSPIANMNQAAFDESASGSSVVVGIPILSQPPPPPPFTTDPLGVRPPATAAAATGSTTTVQGSSVVAHVFAWPLASAADPVAGKSPTNSAEANSPVTASSILIRISDQDLLGGDPLAEFVWHLPRALDLLLGAVETTATCVFTGTQHNNGTELQVRWRLLSPLDRGLSTELTSAGAGVPLSAPRPDVACVVNRCVTIASELQRLNKREASRVTCAYIDACVMFVKQLKRATLEPFSRSAAWLATLLAETQSESALRLRVKFAAAERTTEPSSVDALRSDTAGGGDMFAQSILSSASPNDNVALASLAEDAAGPPPPMATTTPQGVATVLTEMEGDAVHALTLARPLLEDVRHSDPHLPAIGAIVYVGPGYLSRSVMIPSRGCVVHRWASRKEATLFHRGLETSLQTIADAGGRLPIASPLAVMLRDRGETFSVVWMVPIIDGEAIAVPPMSMTRCVLDSFAHTMLCDNALDLNLFAGADGHLYLIAPRAVSGPALHGSTCRMSTQRLSSRVSSRLRRGFQPAQIIHDGIADVVAKLKQSDAFIRAQLDAAPAPSAEPLLLSEPSFVSRICHASSVPLQFLGHIAAAFVNRHGAGRAGGQAADHHVVALLHLEMMRRAIKYAADCVVLVSRWFELLPGDDQHLRSLKDPCADAALVLGDFLVAVEAACLELHASNTSATRKAAVTTSNYGTRMCMEQLLGAKFDVGTPACAAIDANDVMTGCCGYASQMAKPPKSHLPRLPFFSTLRWDLALPVVGQQTAAAGVGSNHVRVMRQSTVALNTILQLPAAGSGVRADQATVFATDTATTIRSKALSYKANGGAETARLVALYLAACDSYALPDDQRRSFVDEAVNTTLLPMKKDSFAYGMYGWVCGLLADRCGAVSEGVAAKLIASHLELLESASARCDVPIVAHRLCALSISDATWCRRMAALQAGASLASKPTASPTPLPPASVSNAPIVRGDSAILVGGSLSNLRSGSQRAAHRRTTSDGSAESAEPASGAGTSPSGPMTRAHIKPGSTALRVRLLQRAVFLASSAAAGNVPLPSSFFRWMFGELRALSPTVAVTMLTSALKAAWKAPLAIRGGAAREADVTVEAVALACLRLSSLAARNASTTAMNTPSATRRGSRVLLPLSPSEPLGAAPGGMAVAAAPPPVLLDDTVSSHSSSSSTGQSTAGPVTWIDALRRVPPILSPYLVEYASLKQRLGKHAVVVGYLQATAVQCLVMAEKAHSARQRSAMVHSISASQTLLDEPAQGPSKAPVQPPTEAPAPKAMAQLYYMSFSSPEEEASMFREVVSETADRIQFAFRENHWAYTCAALQVVSLWHERSNRPLPDEIVRARNTVYAAEKAATRIQQERLMSPLDRVERRALRFAALLEHIALRHLNGLHVAAASSGGATGDASRRGTLAGMSFDAGLLHISPSCAYSIDSTGGGASADSRRHSTAVMEPVETASRGSASRDDSGGAIHEQEQLEHRERAVLHANEANDRSILSGHWVRDGEDLAHRAAASGSVALVCANALAQQRCLLEWCLLAATIEREHDDQVAARVVTAGLQAEEADRRARLGRGRLSRLWQEVIWHVPMVLVATQSIDNTAATAAAATAAGTLANVESLSRLELSVIAESYFSKLQLDVPEAKARAELVSREAQRMRQLSNEWIVSRMDILAVAHLRPSLRPLYLKLRVEDRRRLQEAMVQVQMLEADARRAVASEWLVHFASFDADRIVDRELAVRRRRRWQRHADELDVTMRHDRATVEGPACCRRVCKSTGPASDTLSTVLDELKSASDARAQFYFATRPLPSTWTLPLGATDSPGRLPPIRKSPASIDASPLVTRLERPDRTPLGSASSSNLTASRGVLLSRPRKLPAGTVESDMNGISKLTAASSGGVRLPPRPLPPAASAITALVAADSAAALSHSLQLGPGKGLVSASLAQAIFQCSTECRRLEDTIAALESIKDDDPVQPSSPPAAQGAGKQFARRCISASYHRNTLWELQRDAARYQRLVAACHSVQSILGCRVARLHLLHRKARKLQRWLASRRFARFAVPRTRRLVALRAASLNLTRRRYLLSWTTFVSSGRARHLRESRLVAKALLLDALQVHLNVACLRQAVEMKNLLARRAKLWSIWLLRRGRCSGFEGLVTKDRLRRAFCDWVTRASFRAGRQRPSLLAYQFWLNRMKRWAALQGWSRWIWHFSKSRKVSTV